MVLCKKGVEEPLKVVRHVLERLDLSLNETKTHIVDATEASFDFLGFTLQMSWGAKSGKPYPNVRPSDKAVKKIKARLTELTGRELTCIPLEDVVRNVNRSLRGWANQFHYRNSSLGMSKVRNHAEERLRTHLRRRHKVKDRGMSIAAVPAAACSRRDFCSMQISRPHLPSCLPTCTISRTTPPGVASSRCCWNRRVRAFTASI
jgi:RNA-directed DNA polymerase